MKVLFLCTGNSCRSQMAEGFGRRYLTEGHAVYSAGISPQGVNPLSVISMAAAGVNINDQQSNDLSGVPVDQLDLVVSLCCHAEENLPEELEGLDRVYWPLSDPADAEGDQDARLASFATIRDDIEKRVDALLGSQSA